MKKLVVLIFLLRCAYAQQYDTIPVGLTTTVHLVFDSPVKSYDLGSGYRMENGIQVSDVLIRKVEKRLQLAASIEKFETTNLFIEIEGGIYNFILVYEEKPKKMIYKFAAESEVKKSEMESAGKPAEEAKLTDKIEAVNNNKYHTVAQYVIKKQEEDLIACAESQRISYYIIGIYTHESMIYIHLVLTNRSAVDYMLGYEAFFIVDSGKRGNKKAPKQLENFKPVYLLGENSKISNGMSLEKVYVFNHFSIGKGKILRCEFWEGNNGQRKAELKVSSNAFLRAKPIDNNF